MDFKDFKGSHTVISSLEKSAAEKRLPHAVLIDGGTFEQRSQLAQILSKAFVCSGEKPPCGKCSNCLKADSGNHGDIKVISGGETQRSFHVESIRQIRSEIYIAPNEAPCKVYVLHNAQSMSVEAQNALLKTLEEPPEFAVFILTCDSKTKMLETIRSRTTSYTLDSDLSFDKSGRFNETAASLGDALTKADEFALLSATGVLEKDKELLAGTLHALGTLFRDALVLYGGGKTLLSGNFETANLLRESFTPEQLLKCFNTAEELENSLRLNPNQNLLITRVCSSLRAAIGR